MFNKKAIDKLNERLTYTTRDSNELREQLWEIDRKLNNLIDILGYEFANEVILTKKDAKKYIVSHPF